MTVTRLSLTVRTDTQLYFWPFLPSFIHGAAKTGNTGEMRAEPEMEMC